MNYSPELRQVVRPLGKAAGAGDNMLVWATLVLPLFSQAHHHRSAAMKPAC